jgi:hypothetical protein
LFKIIIFSQWKKTLNIIEDIFLEVHLNYVLCTGNIYVISKSISKSISFSGGGYNCTYHMGIIRYIFENPDMFKGTKYLGASGGAGICAIILCFESDPDRFKILDQMNDVVIGMKSMNLNLSDQVRHYTDELIKHITIDRFNKNVKGTDQCHISVTCVNSMIIKNVLKIFLNVETP